jgi:hypothetical protein
VVCLNLNSSDTHRFANALFNFASVGFGSFFWVVGHTLEWNEIVEDTLWRQRADHFLQAHFKKLWVDRRDAIGSGFDWPGIRRDPQT